MWRLASSSPDLLLVSLDSRIDFPHIVFVRAFLHWALTDAAAPQRNKLFSEILRKGKFSRTRLQKEGEFSVTEVFLPPMQLVLSAVPLRCDAHSSYKCKSQFQTSFLNVPYY